MAYTVFWLNQQRVLSSNGSGLGHDWYCPDPATHAKYTKHLNLHLDHSAEAIAEVLDKIYNNPSLNTEQKHEKLWLF